jgi:hypothetical protein
MNINSTIVSLRAEAVNIINSHPHFYSNNNSFHENIPSLFFLKNIDKVIELFEEKIRITYGKNFKIVTVTNSELKSTLGYFKLVENGVVICINGNMSNCWQRIVILKELSHILYDNNNSIIEVSTLRAISDKQFDTFEQTIYQTANFNKVAESDIYSDPIDAELAYVLFACELCVPLFQRNKINALMKEIDNKESELQLLDIAKALMVPVQLLGRLYSYGSPLLTIDSKFFEAYPITSYDIN